MFRSSAKLPMYHGTASGKSNEILRSILKNGLVPDPPSRAYKAPYSESEEDTFADLDLETETSMRLDEWKDADGFSIMDNPIQLQRATGAVLRGADTALTQEMLDFFEQRTDQHINRVKKYMLLLDGFEGLTFEELRERAEQHDADKRDPELKLPYVWITEYYRVKNSGEPVPASLQQQYDAASEASDKHVHQNVHHPEAHGSIEDMDTLDLVEMVADWSAMAEELGEGSARGWADKNVGTKWKFSPEKKRLIYKAIDRLEAATGDKQVAASVVFQGSRYDLITASVVENHIRPHSLNVAGPKAIRKFMRELVDELDDVLDLAEADELGALGPGGKEVMRILGIPAGPEVGEVLRWLQDQQDEYAAEGKSLDPVEAECLLLEHFGA